MRSTRLTPRFDQSVSPCTGRPNTRERGIALVITMWLTVIISLAVMGFAFTMHVEARIASFHRKQFKAKHLALGGVELGKFLLAWDYNPANPEQDATIDHLGEAWALGTNIVLQTGIVDVRIVDENRKLNINLISDVQGNSPRPEILESYLEKQEAIDEELDVEAFIDSIVDWIDQNDLRRLNGAESEDYLSLPIPYRAKDGPLESIEELLLINGITMRTFLGRDPVQGEEFAPMTSDQGMMAHWTATSGRGRLNVNTAPPEILALLPGSDGDVAARIVERRNGPDGIEGTEDDEPFQALNEVLAEFTIDAGEAREVGRFLTTRSSYFTIISTGQSGNVKKTVEALVLRSQQNIRIIRWREGQS
ncbi:MAG: type II secretion system protein GspK [Verrucomicrobiota bacterium]|jgi:general secretion pathway protein K|nr:type II secretion system protein GspK [Verrucomicrobiota bacterium]MDD8045217.1 type II secretion system protein GspK [Verrucomicrobiota bacterium]MDI9383066.1 type II secretion system protein GspK [Verrucomicrobiota bacterium]HCF95193.1 hypothetical protein [Verrucomicrobiota bacterium]